MVPSDRRTTHPQVEFRTDRHFKSAEMLFLNVTGQSEDVGRPFAGGLPKSRICGDMEVFVPKSRGGFCTLKVLYLHCMDEF